jgi:hypothetical protein
MEGGSKSWFTSRATFSLVRSFSYASEIYLLPDSSAVTRTGCGKHHEWRGVLGEVLYEWAPPAHYCLSGPKASEGDSHKGGEGA